MTFASKQDLVETLAKQALPDSLPIIFMALAEKAFDSNVAKGTGDSLAEASREIERKGGYQL